MDNAVNGGSSAISNCYKAVMYRDFNAAVLSRFRSSINPKSLALSRALQRCVGAL